MSLASWIERRWPDHWHHISGKNAYDYSANLSSVSPPNPPVPESLTRDGASASPLETAPTATLTLEATVANALVTEFKKIESFFASWWKRLPAWNVIAISALNVAAPLLETIVDLADPAAGAVITPIITEIQSKFGTAASLISAANTTNLSATLSSIVTSLPTLLSLANITNPTSVAKATSAVTTIISEIQAILAAIPTPVPAAPAQAPQPPIVVAPGVTVTPAATV